VIRFKNVGYKVVRWEIDGAGDYSRRRFYSYSMTQAIDPQASPYSIPALEYSTEFVTQPRKGDGPLSLFHSIGDARLFIKTQFGIPNVSIFEARYKKSKRQSLFIRVNGPGSKIIRRISPQRLPYGTVLAEKVILIEEVEV